MTKKYKKHFYAKDGFIPDWLITEIKQFISGLKPDDVIKLSLDATKQRTRGQEKFLWGVIYEKHILPYCISKKWKYIKNGTEIPLNTDIIHDFYMNKYCKSDMLVNNDGDVICYKRESSTALSTMQYEDYIEKLRAEFAELGIILPYPLEDEEELKSLEESMKK